MTIEDEAGREGLRYALIEFPGLDYVQLHSARYYLELYPGLPDELSTILESMHLSEATKTE
jgi:hypothetical protein